MTDDRHVVIVTVVSFLFLFLSIVLAAWHNAYVNQKLVASGYCQIQTQINNNTPVLVWQKCAEPKAEQGK